MIEEVKKIHDKAFGEGIACQYDYSLKKLSLNGIQRRKRQSQEEFIRQICQQFPKSPDNPDGYSSDRPTIVCLCGSTRFKDAFTKAQLEETLAGKIVLTIGCNMKTDTEIFGHLNREDFNAIKLKLDELHKRKIDLADEVLVLNVEGYIGESTISEIAYATSLGKPIKYLDNPDGYEPKPNLSKPAPRTNENYPVGMTEVLTALETINEPKSDKPDVSEASLACPFCGEFDITNPFDKIGLKSHLKNYCEEYWNTEDIV